MKVHHRKTQWMHTAFSLVLLTGLTAIVLVRRDIPTLLVAALFALYVAGNGYIHFRRDDFKPEVMIEYSLLALAVFIVLVSAVKS